MKRYSDTVDRASGNTNILIRKSIIYYTTYKKNADSYKLFTKTIIELNQTNKINKL